MRIDPFELLHIGPFKSKHIQTDEGHTHPLTAGHFVQIDLLVLRLNDSEDLVNTLIQNKASSTGQRGQVTTTRGNRNLTFL